MCNQFYKAGRWDAIHAMQSKTTFPNGTNGLHMFTPEGSSSACTYRGAGLPNCRWSDLVSIWGIMGGYYSPTMCCFAPNGCHGANGLTPDGAYHSRECSIPCVYH